MTTTKQNRFAADGVLNKFDMIYSCMPKIFICLLFFLNLSSISDNLILPYYKISKEDLLVPNLLNTTHEIKNCTKPYYRKLEPKWIAIIVLTFMHTVATVGLFRMFLSFKLLTIIYVFIAYIPSGLSVTLGTHRLWSHRAYQANLPLKLLLLFFQTSVLQDSVINWALIHRQHHKFSDTDGDPHNATRGFFFSHVGWMLVSAHPDVRNKRKAIDMSDLTSDPLLVFQKKYYYTVLMPIIAILIPTVIPMYLWNETLFNSLCANGLRWVLVLHGTFLVNSAAHIYGYKPYDVNIKPVENFQVSIVSLGEGWHNYHHTFPWDYKASELGKYSMNLSTSVLEFFAKIGWAYNLKTVSPDLINKRILRTGDGSRNVLGWDDLNQPKED